jgi:hypothetical protein
MKEVKRTRLAQMIINEHIRSGLTERELATRHGFSQQALQTWKKGAVPRPVMFPALASYLNISVDQVAELAEEAKISSGNTKLPELGAPVMGSGAGNAINIDKFASGYAKPAVGGTYAVRVDGKLMWVNPRLAPRDGNTVLLRTGSSGRLSTWPCSLQQGEEAHVVTLAELV